MCYSFNENVISHGKEVPAQGKAVNILDCVVNSICVEPLNSARGHQSQHMNITEVNTVSSS